MNKQIIQLRQRKRHLQREILKCTKNMIRGSLVKIRRRCRNKECPCYKHDDPKHGFMHSISIPGEKVTQMVYLSTEAASSKDLPLALNSFKRFWQLSKELAEINAFLYKQPFLNKRGKSYHAYHKQSSGRIQRLTF